MSLFFPFRNRWPRQWRVPFSAPSTGGATVLDTLLPFSLLLYEIGQQLGVSQRPHESNQAFAERIEATITERLCALDRLREQLASKE